ncbi:GH16 beta-1 3-glucan recognition protein [Mycena indigotica]|uniref:GH16 beta-1 3-glucan recognition protein n=1 Tax=Mycena indigotica TaxID=2126181 RepID=A0A8H6S1R8_9AGAR|nr:GH16 beta-1 3-glucan recognition protein [Mycena indigotica]KAF7291126.1 GH16 beta-1 3-glucan recognition protein [Mycena indigotica]
MAARPAPLSFASLPPHAPFASTQQAGESEPPKRCRSSPPPIHTANRDPFNPQTPPTSSTALPQQNPFSPPASVRSFSAGGADSPAYPFASPESTRASSLIDVTHGRAFSTYSIGTLAGPNERGSFSRPTTASSSALAGGGSTPTTRREAFASPPARPMTIYATPNTARLRRDRPKSTALLNPATKAVQEEEEIDEKTGKVKKKKFTVRPKLSAKLDKPWVGTKDPSSIWAYLITYFMVLVGLACGGVRIYTGWKSVMLLKGNLCPVLIEDFTNKTTQDLFGTGVAGEGGTFFREVDASGFGNGEFEMTTNSDRNSFIYNNQLYLVPTLTSDVIPTSSILDGAIYNLTGCTYNITHSSGYSTSGHGSVGINTTEGEQADGAIAPDALLDLPAYLAACSAVSNSTQGKILPPIMSARISTRRSARLRFGRVEVKAKLPTGDWLWPAIWMLPVGNVYGGWPLSGEIDIMEARGNGPSYPKQGINYVRSSLNWGPATFLNAVAKTYGWKTMRRDRYDADFHTYALEWDENFMRMYVDSRLSHMFEMRLAQSFWDFGNFPTVVQNGTASVVLDNPWVNGTKAAPFDQPFYLIMNPWLDGSATAPLDFLRAQDKWYPTWPQDISKRAMVVDSVKMWEKC